MRVQRALLSVYDKEGIVDFAKGLRLLGVSISSTGGTLKLLRENGVEADSVETITQTPELLSGRVKTLHPKIFAGLLARRDDVEHMRELQDHGIPLIDMVGCNLYPFRKVVENEDVRLLEALENIDIGGVSLIRAAAKNYKDVAVLIHPKQYAEILKVMKRGEGFEESLLWGLAREAFGYIVEYDKAISGFFHRFKDPARKF
jgi:phosphoribosylaminoimidazolecarboxamide formyltransferase/IMP cyclohydrolase